MPGGHLALTRFIILLSYFQAPAPSAFRLLFRPVLSSCFYLRNDRVIYLFVFSVRARSLWALVRGVATVKFDLLGLRTTSRRKVSCAIQRALI